MAATVIGVLEAMLRAVSLWGDHVVSLNEDRVFVRPREKGLLSFLSVGVTSSRCFVISQVKCDRMSSLAGIRPTSAVVLLRKSLRRVQYSRWQHILIWSGRFRVPRWRGAQSIGNRFRVAIQGHDLPHLVLVQPQRIGISSEELIRRYAVDQLRPPHPLLSTVDKHGQECGPAFSPSTFLFLREWSFAQD